MIMTWSLAYGTTQVYEAEAFHDGKLVYLENHDFELEGDKIIKSTTHYKDKNGKILAIFKNDYSKSLNAPENEMDDLFHKKKSGVRYLNGKLLMFSHEYGKKEESKAVKEYKGKLTVGGQGLHYYLVTHLEEVIKKGKLELKFLIPGRLDEYDFYLKVTKTEPTLVSFEIEIDNWFLRLFAPKLKLLYDRQKKRLLQYEGLSNLKNEKGDMMNVQIKYKYPEGT